MGDIVVVGYRPHRGCEAELDALMNAHVPSLRRRGLATDRPATAMRAADGIVVEIFEWHDGEIAAAHHHPEVQALWARFAAVCDYVKLRDLPEFEMLFAQFAPLPASPER